MPAAIAGVAAFAATPLGGLVINLGLTLVASEVSTLIRQATAPKTGAPVGGISGTVQDSGIVPISFIVGRRATAGSRPYHGYWGKSGKTPNAFYTDVRTIADLPMPNRPVPWLDEQRCTVLWDEEPAPQGYPLAEYRVDGVDHAWMRFRDGSQTTADPFLIDTFGDHETRPFSASMVGRGLTQVVMTYLIDRNLFKGGFPRLVVESEGVPLYDLSLDSTAGGDGPQRRDDPSTWTPSPCLPVQIYNLLMGVYYGDEWVYGMQGIHPSRLPGSSWLAAIAEAKAATPKADGSTEPQYAGGLEITGAMEPAAVIEELLKGCAGRIAEIGGVYKMICGLPATAVYSFTDLDIVVSREQGFDPFPVLEETQNGLQGTYAEPAAGWKMKDAPTLYSDALEAEDDGRRLPADIAYQAVDSGTQVQRLMRAAIDEARRFRRHLVGLPPDAADLEPLDMVAWSSDRQGYADKKHLVEQIDDEPTYIQSVSLQEVDPADYDYDAATQEQPSSVGPLLIVRPPPQPFEGFAAAGAIVLDQDANARRPTIQLFWDGEQYDVQSVLWEVELKSSHVVVASGQLLNVVAGNSLLPPTYLSKQTYRARAKFLPYGNRLTEWSEWLDVTTPDVPEIGPDSITIANLAQELKNIVGPLMDDIYARFASYDELLGDAAMVAMDNALLSQKKVTGLTVRNAAAAAGIIRVEEVAVEAQAAVATLEEEVTAVIGPVGADAFWRMQSTVNAEFGVATAMISVRATNGEFAAFAAAEFVASVGPDGAESEINLIADKFGFMTTDGAFVSRNFAVNADFVQIVSLHFEELLSIDGTTIILDGVTGFTSITRPSA